MNQGKKLRVGGVPEHFNLPWHLALERGLFSKQMTALNREAPCEVEWKDYCCGTGEMIQALKSGEADVVVALTEGLIKDITCNESPIRLLGTYVESPLCWAISAAGTKEQEKMENKIQEIGDLRGKRIGVSRLTSGSHLMSCVLASQRGWNSSSSSSSSGDGKLKDGFEYVVCGNLASLCRAVNVGEAEAFLWETFMTKPFHDSGELTRIGDITTPWPCFMFASTVDVIEEKRDEIRAMMTALQEACQIFATEKEEMISTITERFNLRPEDAAQWYKGVKISASSSIAISAIETAVSALKEADVLRHDYFLSFSDLIDIRMTNLVTDIKTMRLYNKPELISVLNNTLREEGLHVGKLSYLDLVLYDQNHYQGLESVEECVKACGISSSSHVLNIGSSMGGPARYFAGKYGANVTAVELQHDLSALAQELTLKCESELSEKINFITGDILEVGEQIEREEGFDSIVSWLTLLHFDKKRRAQLLKNSFEMLKSGGSFYVEDFVAEPSSSSLSADETHTLQNDVYCHYLPNLCEYIADLQAAGFSVLKFENVSSDWTEWLNERLSKHQRARQKYIRIHGQDIYNRLEYFYGKIATLFVGGKVGGLRLIATKP